MDSSSVVSAVDGHRQESVNFPLKVKHCLAGAWKPPICVLVYLFVCLFVCWGKKDTPCSWLVPNKLQEREDWTQAVCGRAIRVLSAIGTYAKSAVSPDICLRHAHADQDVAHRTLRQSRLPEPRS